MSTVQNINNTQITGTRTFSFANTPPGAIWAMVAIDRTVANGLNSLTVNDTLQIDVYRSNDGGATWKSAAGQTCVGSTIVTKGVTLTQDTLTIGLNPDTTGYQIIATASTPVRIAGTVTYLP